MRILTILIRNFIFAFAFVAPACIVSQNATFSPYSRYGIGERAPFGGAHTQSMGGTSIAWRPDSTMPIFINPGNPASYALCRLTSLEVGGRYNYSQFSTGSDRFSKWGTYFSYASVSVPLGTKSGLSFGMTPYSQVGYDSESAGAEGILNKFGGSGGISKVYLGAGTMPFRNAWVRYRRRITQRPDSLPPISAKAVRRAGFFYRFLSDLSLGANVQYYFGNITTTTRIIYPSTVLYKNTYFERTLNVADFSGNFGLQGAFTVDSVAAKKKEGQPARRALKEQVKFTFGLTGNLRNPLHIIYNEVAYNYILSNAGAEIVRDTIVFDVEQKRRMTLPAEMGAGIGVKKGERLNLVAEAALTGWSGFIYPGSSIKLTDSYRLSLGMNFVPEKYAAGRGAFWRRVNYRFGLSHETGYVKLNGYLISNSFVSAGLGIPVGIGRMSSMVHAGVQVGMLGPGFGVNDDAIVSEKYFRAHVGFTFCDRWFQKFRYD